MLLNIIFVGSLIIGVIMGLVGIGGGVLLLPLLLMSGLNFQQSVATALLLQLVPNTLFGVMIYYKDKHIIPLVGAIVLITSIIGTTIGSYIGSKKLIKQLYLYRGLTILIFIIGIFFAYRFWNYKELE